MCPAPFKATRRLPQARAKASARAGVTYGSSVLATTTLGNGSRTSGTGVKLWTASSTLAIISTSAGATSSAALIPPPPAAATRCATSAQPRLWATSTGGAAHADGSLASERAEDEEVEELDDHDADEKRGRPGPAPRERHAADEEREVAGDANGRHRVERDIELAHLVVADDLREADSEADG